MSDSPPPDSPPPSNTPQFFEQSGIDPGVTVSASLPDPKSAADSARQAAMTMIEHIAELRTRILISVGTLIIMFALGLTFSMQLIQVFQKMAPSSVSFIQRTPGEVLLASVNLAFYFGVAAALPVILYHLLRFVLPGLTMREKSTVSWAVMGGTLLFFSGVCFAYFFVVPSALTFLVDYGHTVAKPELSIREYIAFCSSLLFVTGAMFELPMVLYLLSFTGLITSAQLLREWRWATVLIFIAAAIVTPTQDPVSLLIVGLAMLGLYGLSIIPIKLSGR